MIFSLLAAADVLRTIGSVLLALLILLAMVTVHEFGHYAAGKLLHFKIEEFSVGFGPKLFSHTKRDGEVFSVRLLPLGGFCAFAGEDAEDTHPDAFPNKAPWKRIIVLFAGTLMNYLLALLLILFSFAFCGRLQPMVLEVEPADDPAAAAYSLQDGDIILACEGRSVYLVSDLMDALEGRRAGDRALFKLSRADGEDRTVVETEIVLRSDADFANLADSGALWRALGVRYSAERDVYRVASCSYRGFGFWETVGGSFVYSFRIGGALFRTLGQLLTGDIGLSAFGGPVTTIRLTSQIASRGIQPFLEIAAFIGVNLAVFNLLPIPALDGSKIVFTLIEWVRGKPVPRKIEGAIHAVGFVLLIAFAVLVDLLQLFCQNRKNGAPPHFVRRRPIGRAGKCRSGWI